MVNARRDRRVSPHDLRVSPYDRRVSSHDLRISPYDLRLSSHDRRSAWHVTPPDSAPAV